MSALHFPHHKYHAKRTANGFPSKLEEAVYNLLLFKEKCGEIKDIKRQQIVVLQDGKPDEQIRWRVDFSYVNCESNETVYVESKGIEDGQYKLKLKLWRKLRPFRLEIWKGNYKRPFLAELIEK